jgi:hypothetical protein
LDYLQKQVPFTIVIPTYFPPGISHNPVQIESPEQDPDKKPQIELSYQNEGLAHSMDITEDYEEIQMSANIIFEIRGIQINEEIGNFIRPEYSGSVYSWNLNGVNFNVMILGYDETTCRNVISSMIPSND